MTAGQIGDYMCGGRNLRPQIGDMPKSSAIVPIERIESLMFLIRGHKVMLDSDLAELYGTTTKRLNEQAKRDQSRPRSKQELP